MAFQLDTSGVVNIENDDATKPRFSVYTWSSLDPFTQGYVEALFASVQTDGGAFILPSASNPEVAFATYFAKFRDLAPETLARIIEDCAAYRKSHRRVPNWTADGRHFWEQRASGRLSDFQSLSPYLGDDGRVYLREAA